MDELAKRRFGRIARSLADNLVKYNDAVRALYESGTTLEALLHQHLDSLERAGGQTPETVRIRGAIEQAWKNFNEDTAMPAVESVGQDFDDATIELARLVKALP